MTKMRKSYFFISMLSLFLICSCAKEEDYIVQDANLYGKELVFEAINEDESNTKTEVQSDGKSIWWSPEEDVNIFYGASESSKFTSTNTAPVAKAQFTGILRAFTGETETGEVDYFWATYPFNAGNTCDGSSVTAELPSIQTAKAETFADGQWMTVARSRGLALSFYAVCAGFRFSVTKEGVTSVTFKGNNDEVLAGRARIGMDANNHPVVLENVTEEREITLSAPENETLEVGTLYYITFFPTTFTQGFSLTFNTVTETGTRVYESSIAFNRTDVHRGRNWDQSVSYSDKRIPVAVDLGLSVKWASFNVGATSPTESGGFFAWGEILEKENYSWGTYKWANGWKNTLTKYNTKYGNGGSPDQKTILEANDDVAHVTYHGKWRMPTTTEWSELKSQCSWAYDSSKNGYNVTGPSGETIFIPLAGSANNTDVSYVGEYGSYWTANLASDSPNYAFSASVSQSSQSVGGYTERIYGYCVRAVYDENCTYDLVQSISLNITDLQLTLGRNCTLAVLFTPEDATNQNVSWISSNPEVASVSKGTIASLSIGTATITATSADGNHVATCQVEVIPQETNDYVDWGLSVKWGTRNIGAATSSEYGDYYAWGETTPKDTYSWDNYLWCNGSSSTLTKYNSNSSQGFVDNKQVLEEADDVATVLYGSGWRMPTNTEFSELCTHCSYRYINRDGVWGILFSRNDEAIFLPFSGFKAESDLRALGERGLYWCKNSPDYDSTSAFFYQLFTYTYNPQTASRTQGFSIRPVYFDPE